MSGETSFGLMILLIFVAYRVNRMMAKAKALACSETGKKVAGAGVEYALRRLLK